jgi:hypothetical protein
MSVRQLQKALDDANINWSDCIEKQDLVQKLTQWRGTLTQQQTEQQKEQLVERATESHKQQLATHKDEAPLQPISVVISGKSAVTVSVQVDCTVANLKQQLFDDKLTSFVPAAQRILSRGKILSDDHRISDGAKPNAKFMVLRKLSHALTEVQLTLRLPSAKLRPVRTFAPPSVTILQLKALLQAHHSFPPADCYSLFRSGVELYDEKTLQHFCIENAEAVEFDVVPVVLLKLHASTHVTGGLENGATSIAMAGSSNDGESTSSNMSLVPSSLRTGLIGAGAGAADGAALHITSHMEVCYPPHPVLLPSSRKQMARHCLAYVERDMAAGTTWVRRLQAAMHLAVVHQMLGGVPVQLPPEVAYRAVKKMRRFHSAQRTQRRQQQRQGKSPTKAASSAGFTRGFLNCSNAKDKTKNKQQRKERAIRQAACTAAAVAAAAATTAADCAAAAKKNSKKKKKRKFKSLMAGLMASQGARTANDAKKAQQEILAKANPKIQFSKLDRI